MTLRIGPPQAFDLAAAASGKLGPSRHLLTTVPKSRKWATFQGHLLVDPGPKRSGSSPTTVLVTSPAQALIPTDRRCRARPWLGRDGSQIDSAPLACHRSDDWLTLLDRSRESPALGQTYKVICGRWRSTYISKMIWGVSSAIGHRRGHEL